MPGLRIAAVALAALLSLSMTSVAAPTMLPSGLAPAAEQSATNLQDVRWVCGPYRCWWQPGPVW
jgi:hypothetical protein